MNESKASNTVIDMARYRANAAQKQQPQGPTPVSGQVLDVVMFHLLMAGRAIAAHTNK